MEAEKGELMTRAHPLVKAFCLSHGYELQVMDPQWGAKDIVSDDHSLNPLLLSLIEQTIASTKSKRINFMVRNCGQMEMLLLFELRFRLCRDKSMGSQCLEKRFQRMNLKASMLFWKERLPNR
jgi:hypothetical protein